MRFRMWLGRLWAQLRAPLSILFMRFRLLTWASGRGYVLLSILFMRFMWCHRLRSHLSLLAFNSLYEIPIAAGGYVDFSQADFQFSLWDSSRAQPSSRWAKMTFNSLYEIPWRPHFRSTCCEHESFNSLYEIQEGWSGSFRTVTFTFNSLYEILVLSSRSWLRYSASFNSLYEILWNFGSDNLNLDYDFQFSLWDSDPLFLFFALNKLFYSPF